ARPANGCGDARHKLRRCRTRARGYAGALADRIDEPLQRFALGLGVWLRGVTQRIRQQLRIRSAEPGRLDEWRAVLERAQHGLGGTVVVDGVGRQDEQLRRDRAGIARRHARAHAEHLCLWRAIDDSVRAGRRLADRHGAAREVRRAQPFEGDADVRDADAGQAHGRLRSGDWPSCRRGGRLTQRWRARRAVRDGASIERMYGKSRRIVVLLFDSSLTQQDIEGAAATRPYEAQRFAGRYLFAQAMRSSIWRRRPYSTGRKPDDCQNFAPETFAVAKCSAM